MLHKLDTTLFKGTLANRLAIAPGDPGTFWLHSDPDSLTAYAREMTAEVWNSEKNFWDNPHGRPNHAWDCEYMLQALAWLLNISKRKRPTGKKQSRPAAAQSPQGGGRICTVPPTPTAALSIGDKLGSLRRR